MLSEGCHTFGEIQGQALLPLEQGLECQLFGERLRAGPGSVCRYL